MGEIYKARDETLDRVVALKMLPLEFTSDPERVQRFRQEALAAFNALRARQGGIGEQVNLQPLILLPERDWLYARCDSRFELMVEHGAIAEVEALLTRKLDPALPVMRAIGVPEIAAMLKGELDRPQMIAAGQQATRNYAKRQYTWFRHQPPLDWRRVADADFNLKDIFEGLFQE